MNKSFRKWIKENVTIVLFILMILVALLFGDLNRDAYIENPQQKIYDLVFNAFCFAILSLVNSDGVPALVKWFQADRRKASARSMLVGGLFVSFFCAPLAGIAISLSFALFLWLTVVHAFVRVMRTVKK